MKLKRIIAVFTAAAMLTVPMDCAFAGTAQQMEGEKQYVILAEDGAAYSEAEEEIGEGISIESSVLAENNVLVAELSEDEAETLSENENILIEEDIMLCASTDTQDDGTDSLMAKEDAADGPSAEEPWRRKQEVKERKRRQLEEMDETGEDAKEPEYEWNLRAVGADEAAERAETASKKVKVAVLDSGVDYVTGINLAGYVNLVEEESYVAPIFQDLTGHGTGVAGIITGNGESGLRGVNPNAELYSVKALDESNRASLSRIIRGIYWCIENGMNIINMSFGTPVYSEALERAVSDAHAAGLLMVAAAGNGGDAVEYPAAFPEVMAVAATDAEAQISGFCNVGEELDVAAPGEKIRVASFFNGSVVTHGTSVAVPHVTGVASLLWERDLTKSSDFIRQLISHSAKEIKGVDECGLLDAKYALDCYDAFAEVYDEAAEAPEAELPENAAQPETFEEVAAGEAYVEGRWGSAVHEEDVFNVWADLSTEAVNLVKRGAVYPDKKLSGLKSSNPEWHGVWHRKVMDEDHNIVKSVHEVNYVAILEMVTEIALEGGDMKPYMTVKWFKGMNEKNYNDVKWGINLLKGQYPTLLSGYNTKENRKYFLYGCAIHGIQDVFAHSTVRKDGTYISDKDPAEIKGDNKLYYKKRHETAAKLTKYALECLANGDFSDGTEVLRALKAVYTNEAEYRVIKLEKYMDENGYTAPVITKASIDKPVKK